MSSPLGPRCHVGRGAVQAVPGCSRKKRLQGRVALLSISSTSVS